MPYRRRYKKRRYKKRGKSAFSLAKKALKKVNKISKGVELKFVDRDLTSININDDGDFSISANDPSQGFSDTTRIGDKIRCTHMLLNGRIAIGDDNLNTQVRMIVFWDKRNTISTPADILTLTGTGLAPLGMYQHDLRGDWIKLWDRTFMLTDVNTSVAHFRKVIRLNKTSVFNDGSIVFNQGRINILYISNIDSSQPATSLPTAFVRSRVFYQDS